MRTNQQITDLSLQLLVTAGLAAWCFLVISPFSAIILWGIVLAVALQPLFLWLIRLLHKPGLAALLLGVVGIGVILGPFAFLVIRLFDDIETLVSGQSLSSFSLPVVPAFLPTIPLVGAQLSSLWESARTDLTGVLEHFQPQIASMGKFFLSLGAEASVATLQLLVALIVAIGFMLNASYLGKQITNVIRRRAPAKADNFIFLATSTLQHVIRGVIGVAAVQSALIGIVLFLAGIPWAATLTLLCFILSLLQIGPTLIVLPVLVYAWFTMDTMSALLLTFWLVPAGLVDNVLKPIWMARGLPVPLVIVLLGVIGGTLSFGFLGLFTGPVGLSLGYDIVKVWVQSEAESASAT